MLKTRALIFTAPKQLEIREAQLPSLKENEVLVACICSAISAGTEMLVYRGQFPHLADAHDRVSSNLNYPLSYGYASVGRVIELGKGVERKWLNKNVFAFQPHASHFVAAVDSLIEIREGIAPETASFLPSMETAVNLVQDGAPILGERILVLGQGIVGLLTSSLLAEFPLADLVLADPYELRRTALKVKDLRLSSFDPSRKDFHDLARSALQNGADLTFELSGSPSALNQAIALTCFSGRIVVGSWYGEKRAEVDLGGAFHRSRIKLISSQVSTIAPDLTGRWDKARRFEVTWEAVKRIQPEKWITQRFSLEDAARAYQLLDENPQETIQILFEHSL
jgi:2-desacetyl-2-hydroxyethyl bacteriochlorophyllide A dehydrogenase